MSQWNGKSLWNEVKWKNVLIIFPLYNNHKYIWNINIGRYIIGEKLSQNLNSIKLLKFQHWTLNIEHMYDVHFKK